MNREYKDIDRNNRRYNNRIDNMWIWLDNYREWIKIYVMIMIINKRRY
jgi:hypothetical protein